ncbi:MAG: hypothetical protein ACI901_000199, partial [Octadecabacter sp.]
QNERNKLADGVHKVFSLFSHEGISFAFWGHYECGAGFATSRSVKYVRFG